MPGVGTVYRWELFKLRYQKRTYLGLGASILVPILFVIAIRVQHHNGHGGDFAFSDYLTRSGLAVPLVILLFGAVWMFPLITALVAGDIVAAEHQNGTLKTILTRSRDRGQIFAAKLLAAVTYTVAAVVLLGVVGTLAGSIQFGFHPLVSLSGTTVGPWKGVGLLAASLGVYLLPLLGIAAFGSRCRSSPPTSSSCAATSPASSRRRPHAREGASRRAPLGCS
jgi:ABC-2 type transport system permease protein